MRRKKKLPWNGSHEIKSCTSCVYAYIHHSHTDETKLPDFWAECNYCTENPWQPKYIKNIYTIPEWCPLEDA